MKKNPLGGRKTKYFIAVKNIWAKEEILVKSSVELERAGPIKREPE